MRPLIQNILVTTDNGDKMIKYSIEYAIAPEYEGLSVKELKQIFNFDDCESVPDVAYVTILSEMEEVTIEDIRYALQEELGLKESELIIC